MGNTDIVDAINRAWERVKANRRPANAIWVKLTRREHRALERKLKRLSKLASKEKRDALEGA